MGAINISICLPSSFAGFSTVAQSSKASAQRFIVENINAVLESEKLRFKMQGQPWRAEDDSTLRDGAARGVPIYEIALELSRNISSVRSRCKRLGIEIVKP